jgi:hypothetical protein
MNLEIISNQLLVGGLSDDRRFLSLVEDKNPFGHPQTMICLKASYLGNVPAGTN